MSFHTVTMMVRWAVTGDAERKEFLQELRKLPLQDRKNDERVIRTIKNLRAIWINGTKIEKLAVLGWDEKEAIQTFCNIVEELDNIRKEYENEEKEHGGPPPELRDEDAEKYEKYSNEVRKTFRPK